jgi:hypothetical protein
MLIGFGVGRERARCLGGSSITGDASEGIRISISAAQLTEAFPARSIETSL